MKLGIMLFYMLEDVYYFGRTKLVTDLNTVVL
jgi:hypothetical protein